MESNIEIVADKLNTVLFNKTYGIPSNFIRCEIKEVSNENDNLKQIQFELLLIQCRLVKNLLRVLLPGFFNPLMSET